MKFKVKIGIDIAKKTFDLAYPSENGKFKHRSLPNDEQGIKALIALIQTLEVDMGQVLVCMEHTGVYIEKIARMLVEEGIFVWVVNPFVLNRSHPGLVRLKSDKADAIKICRFAHDYENYAKRFNPKSPAIDYIQSLFRLRRQLVTDKARKHNQRDANRCKDRPCLEVEVTFSRKINELTQEIKNIDKVIKMVIHQVPRLKRIYTILISIPTIGPVTATNMILLTEGFNKINNWRSFACFIGTAPFGNSSANKPLKRTQVSKMGHRKMKAIMNMGVLRQIREGGFFESTYQQMTKGHGGLKPKHHLSALNAIKNKVIKLAFDLIRLDQVFDREIYLANRKNPLQKLVLS